MFPAEHAELLFCPYNYLIDPVIRSSMGINIQHAVLIFDEAHNIEDISRSAAHYIFSLAHLSYSQQCLLDRIALSAAQVLIKAASKRVKYSRCTVMERLALRG